MLKKTLVVVTLSLFMAVAHAAKPQRAGIPAGFGQIDADMQAARQEFMLMQKGSGPSEDDVGDVDSFGRDKTYLGVKSTETVSLQDDCSAWPVDFGACIELPVDKSDSTSVDEFDLAVFELPGKATDSLICFTVTNFNIWEWSNTSGSQEFAVMTVNTTFQIESDVLDGLTNADGDPFNGMLFPAGPAGLSTYNEFRSLGSGEYQLMAPRLTRSCTGGLVSRNRLEAEGLTDKQIKDFFKEPMTITFGVRGTASSVLDASFFYGIRLYGD